MLPQKNRLHFQKDFKKIFASGKGYTGEFFLTKTTSNNLSYSRLSIIIGKNIIKKAVKRNFVKRILSSAIEENWGKVKKGMDIVLILKKNPLLKFKFKEKLRLHLKKEVNRAFKKLGLLL